MLENLEKNIFLQSDEIIFVTANCLHFWYFGIYYELQFALQK